MDNKVFGFDLGKTSIGYCVRDGFNIENLGSIIINKNHGEKITNKNRQRVNKTLQAHKAREDFFINLWQNCGLTPLEKEDVLFKKEFAKENDKIIYNSILLRIALLQNKKLEEWQIYKALFNAIQRRGYDANLPWANDNKTEDEKNNEEYLLKYANDEDGNQMIFNEEYKFPCYYDALRLGLWSESCPENFNRHIPLIGVIKVRDIGLVTPRSLVEKELVQLYLNAQEQLPQLAKYSVEYFLYGNYEEKYASYSNSEFKKYRGSKTDWQGVLGQKIPRFDNRIISKCKLLPKRNVCNAKTIENVSLVLLMMLKNLRLTDEFGEKLILTASDIKQIYDFWYTYKAKVGTDKENLAATITETDIKKVLGLKIKMKSIKANISGRSSFCRRACQLMIKIITEGIKNPATMDVSEFTDYVDTKNGITEEELRKMVSSVGTWDNLYIPDNREENAKNASDEREKTDIIIGSLTNPIVRNRLQLVRDLLLQLKSKHGTPDEVIFEFIRDGADNSLFGAVKANAISKAIKNNEKENTNIVNELNEVNAAVKSNFLKLKLLKMQNMTCAYSGRQIGISDFDRCEIDHIYPRSMGGNDALYNKVLCYKEENQAKAGRIPYEWLHNNEQAWFDYVKRLDSLKEKLGKKKYELLTSKPEDCKKLIESYNGLAETAQIARLAQQMAAMIFGWGLQVEGENRHIYTNNGSITASIRSRYGLNRLLGDDVKKNRQNDKHHALDAICISFSREFKYNPDSKKDEIQGFTRELVENALRDLMPYPYTNKKPLKENLRPLETIYGLRKIDDKIYITNRIELIKVKKEEKSIKNIIDEIIKEDLLSKITLSDKEWSELLTNYIHPKKRTRVKKVLIIETEGTLEYDSNGRARVGEFTDFGTKGVKHQFKHSKGHKGQILYYNNKGKIKVMPIYANQSLNDAREKLEQMGCKLYKKGMMFYTGCLVEVPNEFKAGKNIYPAGVYKLRTIISKGDIKLENSTGKEILSSVTNLVDANFKKFKEE